jgi:hypothetical protein
MFNSYEIFYDGTKKSDLLIQVTALAGLTVSHWCSEEWINLTKKLERISLDGHAHFIETTSIAERLINFLYKKLFKWIIDVYIPGIKSCNAITFSYQ